jgi:hypothetical protein
MAHDKRSRKFEGWLSVVRVLIMWMLLNRQPHRRKELEDWLVRSAGMCWETKKLPNDLGEPLALIQAEIKRLVAHGNCELSEGQGGQTIRLVHMVKTYQPEVDELVSLEQEAATSTRRYKKEGGWHPVEELLPPKVRRGLRAGVAKSCFHVVLETIVNRLKAEGHQSRTGKTGEELYFGAAGTATAPTSRPTGTSAPAPASQDQGAAERDGDHPAVAETPVEQLAAGTAQADEDDEGHDLGQTAMPDQEPDHPAGESPPIALEHPASAPEDAAVEPTAARTAIGVSEIERTAELTDGTATPAGEKPREGGGQGGLPIRPSATSPQRYGRRVIMPSKFANTLVVLGASSGLNRFVKRVRGTPYGAPREVLLSLSALSPVPPEVLTSGDAAQVESWQLDHWGCKSDNEPGKVTVRRLGPTRVEYRFETGEGPPLKWLERVAEDFPTLDFDLYYIAPWEVHGRRTYVRGELSQDWEEQPTAEDQARAGLLDEDYCATCGEPLGEDGQRCPHCELLKPGGAKAGPEETAGDGVGAGQLSSTASKPASGSS